jgi:hypothetical protein
MPCDLVLNVSKNIVTWVPWHDAMTPRQSGNMKPPGTFNASDVFSETTLLIFQGFYDQFHQTKHQQSLLLRVSIS